MPAALKRAAPPDTAQLRAWLEYVAQTAIDWLDELDAPTMDLEEEIAG
jgi:hypothetical protein